MSLVLAIDATTPFDFHQSLKVRFSTAQNNIDYRALLDALRKVVKGSSFDQMIAFASINPEHEGQQKFCGFLRSLGFHVDETDYRDAFVNPNRSEQYQRLSTRMAYLAGLLVQKGRQEQPHIVAVTDAFDVYYPLLDYVENRGGKVTIAFFRAGMEERWNRVGLFDPESPIPFADLSDYAKSILGVDLSLSSGRSKSRDGLSNLDI